jgi:hypothetical protein
VCEFHACCDHDNNFFLIVALEGKRPETEHDRKGKKWSHKFWKNMCGIIQRIPAHLHSYLHAPP